MSNSEEWVSVCQQTDLIAFSGITVLIGESQVAIFYMPDLDQQLYAIDNYDPFSGTNVLSRGIVGDLKGKAVVASPIYKQHFELSSGRSLEDDNVAVGRWPVKIENGEVLLSSKRIMSC